VQLPLLSSESPKINLLHQLQLGHLSEAMTVFFLIEFFLPGCGDTVIMFLGIVFENCEDALHALSHVIA